MVACFTRAATVGPILSRGLAIYVIHTVVLGFHALYQAGPEDDAILLNVREPAPKTWVRVRAYAPRPKRKKEERA
jgi:hypothetical protein